MNNSTTSSRPGHSNRGDPSAHSDTTQAFDGRDRALILGGGGAAGNAWQIGLIAGLTDAGVDVTNADLIVGTSSGSTVAAQITSEMSASELYAAIVTDAPQLEQGAARRARGVRPQPRPPRAPQPEVPRPQPRPMDGASYLEWSNAIIASATDAADMRRKISAAALEADATHGTHSARWRDVVAGRLPAHKWPDRRVLISAIDARTGQSVTFDRDSGIELVDAVAASTSAMIPYAIGDSRYLNGGYRRNENADLAVGYRRVLVMSPFSGRTRYPLEWGMHLAAQVAELHAAGSTVETVFPDAGAGDVFDANALDPSTRRQAARGGYEQGKGLGPALAEFWLEG